MESNIDYFQLFYIAIAISGLIINTSILYVLNEVFKKYKLFEKEGVEYENT